LKERIQDKSGIWNLDKKTKWNSNLRHGTSQNPSPKAEQERKEGRVAGWLGLGMVPRAPLKASYESFP
jgi:hypothetical protein